MRKFRRKNKNSIIIILVLFISIGFAYLSSVLNINSNITFMPQSFSVYFDNVVINENSSNLDEPTLSNEDKTVSFQTTINEPSDFYEFTFDVVNDGTMDAAISEVLKSGLTTEQEQYLSYTARYYGDREIKVDDILHAGYKEKIIVRVEYKYDVDEVVSLGNISFTFGLNFIKRDLQKDYGEEVWSIDYTGAEHEFTVKKTGKYKLETWGAQGADVNEELTGGYGGYSTGTISLTKNKTYYVNVGGQGELCNNEIKDGGYNGGGGCSEKPEGNLQSDAIYLFGAGGGATHISSNSGLLKDLESLKGTLVNDKYYASSAIFIVAAGGGGAGKYINGADFRYGIGGSGGGYIGNNYIASLYQNLESWVNAIPGTGATQIAGGTSLNGDGDYEKGEYGTFGQGGTFAPVIKTAACGGGGGFYGGSGNRMIGGTGGSGYIGNQNLTNKIMYCYNCQESTSETDETHIKTRGTSNISEEPLSNYAKIGNGYVRITYLGN